MGWKKWWGKIVGAIVGIIGTIVTGNMMVGFQLFNLFSSLGTAVNTGNWGGFGAGLAGGLIGGYVGGALAGKVAGFLGENAFTFSGGFLIGATEMGIAGFGGGFFGALGSGASFSDALKSGGIGFGAGAAIGGLVQGSYLAGWQKVAHGMDRDAVGKAAGVERKVSLEVVRKPLPGPAKKFVGEGPASDHWGLRIKDNYNEFKGTWDFDYIHNPLNDFKALVIGQKVPGIAGLATHKVWTDATLMSTNLQYITDVYGNIQTNLGRHYYKLDCYTCQTWVNRRLFLMDDNFVQ